VFAPGGWRSPGVTARAAVRHREVTGNPVSRELRCRHTVVRMNKNRQHPCDATCSLNSVRWFCREMRGEIRGHALPSFVLILPIARLARTVVSGLPHRVTQRGNRRGPSFLRKADSSKSPRGKDQFPAPDYVAHIGKRRHVVRWIGSQDHQIGVHAIRDASAMARGFEAPRRVRSK
jgi:hypothetical protein